MYDIEIKNSVLVRSALLCGVVAPLLYAFSVIWGATLFPGYSHISDPISSLTQAGRHSGVESLFVIYNVLVLNFAFTGISLNLGKSRWGVAAYAFLLTTAIAGLLMAAFPQDPIGAPATAAGVGHIVLAAIASLASVATVACAAMAWHDAGYRRMATFSWVCLGLIIISGPLAAAGAAFAWPSMGLFERVTIGAFEAWMLLQASVLLRDRLPSLVVGHAGS